MSTPNANEKLLSRLEKDTKRHRTQSSTELPSWALKNSAPAVPTVSKSAEKKTKKVKKKK